MELIRKLENQLIVFIMSVTRGGGRGGGNVCHCLWAAQHGFKARTRSVFKESAVVLVPQGCGGFERSQNIEWATGHLDHFTESLNVRKKQPHVLISICFLGASVLHDDSSDLAWVTIGLESFGQVLQVLLFCCITL